MFNHPVFIECGTEDVPPPQHDLSGKCVEYSTGGTFYAYIIIFIDCSKAF